MKTKVDLSDVDAKWYFAEVHWQPADIQAIRPDMTMEQAIDFLDSSEDVLQCSMILHGKQVIEQELLRSQR